ncbi:MAG: ISL3 family transposase [Deltaproteobacteria bacterium]|jgi:transposase
MRATTLLRLLSRLHPQHTVVEAFEFAADHKTLVLDVKPTTRVPVCGVCEKRGPVHDHRCRVWRHTDLGETLVHLRARLARVVCPACGVTTQKVPWAGHGAWHTYDFEDLVAYKAQGTDRTRVASEMRISWNTVGTITMRVVERLLNKKDRLDGLSRIGLDDLSYRKGHHYISVVVDHDAGRLVWAGEGRTGETIARFFDELGPERAAAITLATIDMSASYEAALRKHAPNAEVVFDRFHVQRLAHDALDEVRREIMRGLKGTPEGKAMKQSRWALQRNVENETPKDKAKLSAVMSTNQPLFRAYLLKATLVAILDGLSVEEARTRLEGWVAWAARSRLQPFVRAGRTIRKHMEGILAYVRTRLSNGRSEGFNGKARVVTRRSFGFHSAAPLIATLYLCCSGLKLSSRHP